MHIIYTYVYVSNMERHSQKQKDLTTCRRLLFPVKTPTSLHKIDLLNNR